MIFVRFGYKNSLGSSFFGAWADFHWNCERSFNIIMHSRHVANNKNNKNDNHIKAYWPKHSCIMWCRTLLLLFVCLLYLCVALLCFFTCHIRILRCHVWVNFVISTGSQKGISKKETVFCENVRFCSELLTKILFVNCWAALLHDKALQGRQRSIIYVQIGRPQCKPSLLFWVILAWSESIHRSFMTWSSRSHWAIVMWMAAMYWQDIMNRC